MGDFTHVFWDCPKLLDFKLKIKPGVGINFTLDTALYIVGIPPDKMTDR